jgi:signal transduction histidine kinase
MIARRPDLARPQIVDFVGEILSSTGRMQRAVELLVDVASLEAGRVVPDPRPVTAASIVDDRLASWRARYPERAADLRRRVSARLPDVEVDPRWLRKALDELADNAVKYSAAGSVITVAASLPGADAGVVRIAVRDAGTGFDESRRAELLRDFSQADASETRATGGLGLGLGFVSRVADQLGLALHVMSRAGRGSEFALDLPIAAGGGEDD